MVEEGANPGPYCSGTRGASAISRSVSFSRSVPCAHEKFSTAAWERCDAAPRFFRSHQTYTG